MTGRVLSDEEMQFVEDSLPDGSQVFGATQDGGVDVVVPPPAPQKSRWRGVLNPLHWAGFFVALPFVLAGGFALFLTNAESMLGGSQIVADLSGTSYGSVVEAASAQAGLRWLPEFLDIYRWRMWIVVGLFAVSFAVAGLIAVGEMVIRRRKSRRAGLHAVKGDG